MFVWYDTRFVDKNFTDAQALKCFPGMILPEQVDEIWKPDIFLEGTMDGVNILQGVKILIMSHKQIPFTEWIHGE